MILTPQIFGMLHVQLILSSWHMFFSWPTKKNGMNSSRSEKNGTYKKRWTQVNPYVVSAWQTYTLQYDIIYIYINSVQFVERSGCDCNRWQHVKMGEWKAKHNIAKHKIIQRIYIYIICWCLLSSFLFFLFKHSFHSVLFIRRIFLFFCYAYNKWHSVWNVDPVGVCGDRSPLLKI